jgi:hypothetical protein
MCDQDFLAFGKKKILFLMANTNDNIEVTLHPNVFITNNTPFEEYYKSIQKHLESSFEDTLNYGDIDQLVEFELWV